MKINTINGTMKTVAINDPLWCKLDGKRVRLHRIIDKNTIEVSENGKVLPDWRHVSQLIAY